MEVNGLLVPHRTDIEEVELRGHVHVLVPTDAALFWLQVSD